jgi:putative tryptophan/tyrosine transport system substrate-binding protein
VTRREFITLLGGAAAAWPLAARAQQGDRIRRVGVLMILAADDPESSARVTALTQGLQQLGWMAGHNVQIEYRWGADSGGHTRSLAAELVALAPDVILTVGVPALAAVKQVTSTVPIVFVNIVDPVGAGFVEGLARPGGNVSGLSAQMTDTAAKRLETLREAVPDLRRLAILVNVGNPFSVLEMREAQAAASALGVEAVILEIRGAEDIAPAFETSKGRADALFVASDPLLNSNRVRINSLALGARLPTMHGLREYVEAGGLMSYGANFPDLFRRAAEYVDKILRGAKPADIPVEQPRTFELVINLKTARALGLDVPPTLLARADEVIE